MQQDVLINWSPQETRVALVENGAVQELHVYLGKVARVLPGMQSAFVDIGLERAAFLHVADLWHRQPDGEPPQVARSAQSQIPIERQVFEGQALTVQVIKDPIGSKGARLSTQISIAGRLLVFLPQDDHVGVSQKIPAALRDELRGRLQALTEPDGGGFILRTNGEDASDAELAEDIAYLRRTWAGIKQASMRSRPGSLLHQDLSLLQRVLRDLTGEGTQSIKVDSREQFDILHAFGTEFMPSAVGKLQHYKGERPIFDLYGVDEEIARALGRRVELKSGGYLIIDQTEALTTMDVNTGGFVGARNFDDTIFKTNLEAAHAIARQLRLRNLGGIIILDFIDMENLEHRNAVLTELKKTLSRDRTKVSVSGFSALGLVEMTRKRTRESLAHILCEPCPACMGKGQVKTSRTICYEILRELMREAKQFNPREFRILASQEVVDLFLEEESQHLAMLGDFIGKQISLQVETTYHQEQYDVILM
jgi:ribonuclease G